LISKSSSFTSIRTTPLQKTSSLLAYKVNNFIFRLKSEIEHKPEFKPSAELIFAKEGHGVRDNPVAWQVAN
jgi:hypothetical protein